MALTKPLTPLPTVPELTRVTLVAVRPAFKLILPPYTVIGPLTDCAVLTVMAWVLPDRPSVKPPRPLVVRENVKPELKLAPADWTTSEPGPLKALLLVVGASLCSTSVPALIVVAPLYVLAPLSVQVPVPALVRVPAPVPMMLAMLPPAVPPSVRPNPLPVMVPVLLRLMLPVSPTMDEALSRLISPA